VPTFFAFFSTVDPEDNGAMKELSLWTKRGVDDEEFGLITAYLDESGHSASSRVVAMAGAIGAPRDWRCIREHWTSVLARYGVRVFRMSHFENRFGEFRDWNNERRHALMAELLSVLEETFLIPIGTAVVVQDFRDLSAKTQRGLLDPWYLCFQMCLNDVATGTLMVTRDELWDSKRCAVVLEQQSEFWRAPYLFAQMLERELFAEKIGLLGYAGKHTCVKLHLADLIAYELRKHVENCFFDPGRPTRWPMKRLLARPFLANVFDNQGRLVRTEGSDMAVFRGADTAHLNFSRKIILDRNLST
jgi:hypothetical protein